MESVNSNTSFFVKIEGHCHSNHRSPQGVYKIEVVPEKSLAHSACAAIQIARESVPFFSENPDGFTVRAFSNDGQEVSIPRVLVTAHEMKGRYFGRATQYPDAITLQ